MNILKPSLLKNMTCTILGTIFCILTPICSAQDATENKEQTAIATYDSNGLPKAYINKFVAHKDFVYAGTDGSGIYITSDNAQTWLPFNDKALATAKIRDLHIRENYLYAATNKGVFKTKVAAATSSWKKVGVGGLKNKELAESNRCGSFLEDVTAVTSYKNFVYAGTAGGGVFKISDDEDTWNWIKFGATNHKFYIAMMGLIVNGGYLYVVIKDETPGIFRLEYDRTAVYIGDYYLCDSYLCPFTSEQQLVRAFNIIKEADGDYLYTAIKGKVSKIKTDGTKKIEVINFQDRIVNTIYTNSDINYIVLGTAKGQIRIPKNLDKAASPQQIQEVNAGLPQDASITALYIDNGNSIIATHDGVFVISENTATPPPLPPNSEL